MKVAGVTDVIFADREYFITAAGNDTTGDGTAGAPWLTLQKAFDYISYLRLAYPADIDITIGDGHFSWAGPIFCTSPWGARIRVRGTNVHEKTMSSVQSAAGANITVNLNNVTNIEVGDLAIFHTCAGGTTPYHMVGAHVVNNVDGVNSRITVTTQSLVGLPSGNVTATVEILKTVISIPSGGGIYVGPALKVDKLGLVGPIGSLNGFYTTMSSRLTLSESSYVGITGFANGLSQDQLSAVVVGGGAGRLSISGCSTAGIYIASFAAFNGTGVSITGCATGALSAGRSMIILESAKVHGNTLGLQASRGGYINATSADTTGNGTAVSPTANSEGNDHAYIET